MRHYCQYLSIILLHIRLFMLFEYCYFVESLLACNIEIFTSIMCILFYDFVANVYALTHFSVMNRNVLVD